MGDAEPDQDPVVQPSEATSSWHFDWWRLAGVLVVALVALVVWRWIGGSDGDSLADDPSDRVASEGPTSTAAPAEVAPRAPTTTAARPTPTTPPPTTTIAPERQVLIRGEMKPCRYGANCLVASFTIEGFDERPERFVCVFSNGRYDFQLRSDRVDDACLTADAGDTIAIEVDGVVSATISETDLDGG